MVIHRLLILYALLCSSAFGSIMAVTREGFLYSVDAGNGFQARWQGGGKYYRCESMAMDRFGNLYSAATTSLYSSTSLIRANAGEFSWTDLGIIKPDVRQGADIRAMAFSPSGCLYAINYSPAGSALYSLSVGETLVDGHFIGYVSNAGKRLYSIEGMTFGPDGRLWAYDLYRGVGLINIDPITGAYTDVSPDDDATYVDGKLVQGAPWIQSLAFDSSGTLYGYGWYTPGGGFYTIDTNTAAVTFVAIGRSDFRGFEFVPEPSTVLFCSLVICLGGCVRSPTLRPGGVRPARPPGAQ